VAVELSDGDGLVSRRPEQGRCGLEVILAKGPALFLGRATFRIAIRLVFHSDFVRESKGLERYMAHFRRRSDG